MGKAKQPVSINGVEFDALIESEEGYEAQIPEYPTEKGFSVSDNITLKPDSLNMILFVTDTPVTWKNRHGGGPGYADRVVAQLKELYFAKQPVTVTTSDMVYENMAIANLSIKKSKEIGYAREITVAMKKIIVTESSTVTIPDSYGKSGATGASAGTASTTAASSGGSGSGGGSSGNNGGGSKGSGKSGGSILYNAASSFGLL